MHDLIQRFHAFHKVRGWHYAEEEEGEVNIGVFVSPNTLRYARVASTIERREKTISPSPPCHHCPSPCLGPLNGMPAKLEDQLSWKTSEACKKSEQFTFQLNSFIRRLLNDSFLNYISQILWARHLAPSQKEFELHILGVAQMTTLQGGIGNTNRYIFLSLSSPCKREELDPPTTI